MRLRLAPCTLVTNLPKGYPARRRCRRAKESPRECRPASEPLVLLKDSSQGHPRASPSSRRSFRPRRIHRHRREPRCSGGQSTCTCRPYLARHSHQNSKLLIRLLARGKETIANYRAMLTNKYVKNTFKKNTILKRIGGPRSVLRAASSKKTYSPPRFFFTQLNAAAGFVNCPRTLPSPQEAPSPQA